MLQKEAPAAAAYILGVRAQLIQRAELPLLRGRADHTPLSIPIDVRLMHIEILRLADQRADCLLTVTPSPAKVVEQLLDELGRAKLNDTANALMIDTHPKGLVRHHHTDLALDELQLGALPLAQPLFLARRLALRVLARALVVAPLHQLAAMVASHANGLRGRHAVLCSAEHLLKRGADLIH
eukprot:55104-Prymnesium_polylepis.1